VAIGKVAAHLCLTLIIKELKISVELDRVVTTLNIIYRAALHLEAGPIRCVRGLKSSLVIGQKAQIGPNPFKRTSRADLVV
jgi:hypothetical protein